MMNLVKMLKPLKRTAFNAFRYVKANRTTLYAIGATVGLVATAAASVKAAIKTKEYKDEYADATFAEKAKFVGRLWVTPVVVGGVTIFCIWRGHKIHLENEASLAAMSAFWKTKYNELDKKIPEKLTEEECEEVKEEIYKDKMAKKDVPNQEGLPKDVFWVYDEFTDQFIRTSGSQFNWALYSMNKRFSQGLNVDYNYFLRLIGGKPSKHMKDYGWSWDNDDLITTMYEVGYEAFIDCSPVLRIESGYPKMDGMEVPVLSFSVMPEHLYISQK